MFDVYVINLGERKDRLENIKKYFSEYNIIPVEAIKHTVKKNGLDGLILIYFFGGGDLNEFL